MTKVRDCVKKDIDGVSQVILILRTADVTVKFFCNYTILPDLVFFVFQLKL